MVKKRTPKELYQKANELYTNIRTIGKNGQSSKWAYYYCMCILNGKKDVPRTFDQKDAKKINGGYINQKLTKKQYLQKMKEYCEYIERKKQLPNHVTILGKIKIKPKIWNAYCGYIFKVYYETGKLPESQPIKSNIYHNGESKCKSPYVSKPHFYDEGAGYLGQINPYNCGPHSVRQALKKFGIDVSESTLASVAGTGYDGTDHDGLNTAIAWAARKFGVKLDVEWVNFSGLGKNDAERFKALGEILCQSNKAAFTHIGYEDSGEDYGDDIFGHYEYLDRINTDTNYVRALNSLGYRDGYGYYGHLQDRSFKLEAHYISQISQKGICIITKR